MQSHPWCRMCFGKYQASSAALEIRCMCFSKNYTVDVRVCCVGLMQPRCASSGRETAVGSTGEHILLIRSQVPESATGGH